MTDERSVAERIGELLRAGGLVGNWRILERIDGGGNHQTFRVQANSRRFAVRLPACVPRHASSLATEQTVLRQAAAAGIAPALVYFDPADGAQVSHWVPGRALRSRDLDAPVIALALGRLIHRLQRLQVDVPAYDLAGAAHAYAAALESARVDDRHVARRLVRLESRVRWYLDRPQAPVLSHNDLVAGNVLRHEGRLLLIDWEYAAPADPLFDVATVLALHRLGEPARAALLDATGQGPDDDALRGMIETVRLLAWAWALSECRRRPGDARPRSWLERIDTLLHEAERRQPG